MRLFFATSSDLKFQQYVHIADEYDISVRRGSVISGSLTEPQGSSSDIREMSNLVFHPLRQSARFISQAQQIPYFVEDTMLVIDDLSKQGDGNIGLPGPDTKNWWLNLGVKGLLKLLEHSENRAAHYICQIGIFYGAGRYSCHHAATPGFIATNERVGKDAFAQFPRTNPYFFHSIFEVAPAGPTLAELDPRTFAKHDYRRACFKKVAVEVERFSQTLNDLSSVEQLRLFE